MNNGGWFLDKGRLKTLTDTVLLVGIVLLVYNLATLAGSDPDQFEPRTFSNTLIAYINAFVTVFLYWSLFSAVLNYIPHLNVTLFLLFLTLLITITLIPVTNLLSLQEENQGAANFAAFTNIIPGVLLIIVMKFKRGCLEQLGPTEYRYLMACLMVIPSLFLISFVISFYNSFLSISIPLFILPVLLAVGRRFRMNG
jgi:uncharacterized membrane protein